MSGDKKLFTLIMLFPPIGDMKKQIGHQRKSHVWCPTYLWTKTKKHFSKISEILKLKVIYGETSNATKNYKFPQLQAGEKN